MIDFFGLAIFILITVVLINILAIIAIIFNLVTGSYKRYTEKREYHYQQLYRIKKHLKGDENNE